MNTDEANPVKSNRSAKRGKERSVQDVPSWPGCRVQVPYAWFSVADRGQGPRTFPSPDGAEISPTQDPKACRASSTRTNWSFQVAQSWVGRYYQRQL